MWQTVQAAQKCLHSKSNNNKTKQQQQQEAKYYHRKSNELKVQHLSTFAPRECYLEKLYLFKKKIYLFILLTIQ